MDEDQDRIYVGSKDHILSLNINNISQDPLSVSPRFCESKVALLHAFLFKTKNVYFIILQQAEVQARTLFVSPWFICKAR